LDFLRPEVERLTSKIFKKTREIAEMKAWVLPLGFSKRNLLKEFWINSKKISSLVSESSIKIYSKKILFEI